MKKIIGCTATKLLSCKLPEEYRAEYNDILRPVNAGRLLIFSAASISLSLLTFLIHILTYSSGLLSSGINRMLMINAAFTIIFAVGQTFFLSRNKPPSSLIGLLNYYFVAVHILMLLLIVRFELVERGTIYFFAYGAILIAVVPIFDLLESLTVSFIYMTVMIAILTVTKGSAGVAENIIFVLGMSLGAIGSSRFIYISNTRSFISEKKTTERKNEIERVADELTVISNTDQLTRINNRRGFEYKLAKFWERCINEKKQIAIMMMDLDQFKQFNDHYGHLEGDKCLIAIADAMQASFQRANDLIGRFGGEEFIAAIAYSDQNRAMKQAERFRRKIMDLQISHEFSRASQFVTISIGVAVAMPVYGDNPSDLINKADTALYQAKKNGSNQVVLFQ